MQSRAPEHTLMRTSRELIARHYGGSFKIRTFSPSLSYNSWRAKVNVSHVLLGRKASVRTQDRSRALYMYIRELAVSFTPRRQRLDSWRAKFDTGPRDGTHNADLVWCPPHRDERLLQTPCFVRGKKSSVFESWLVLRAVDMMSWKKNKAEELLSAGDAYRILRRYIYRVQHQGNGIIAAPRWIDRAMKNFISFIRSKIYSAAIIFSLSAVCFEVD